MSRRKKQNDLFIPLVAEERLHPQFHLVRRWKGAEPSRLMMNEVYQDFKDPDGNFLEQFQTVGFDARIFELYLFAYLSRSGYEIVRDYPQPDFIVEREGVSVAMEATTLNPREPESANIHFAPPPKLSPEEIEEKLFNELPIRFGSPLFSKLKNRYWELDHCKGLPFVIAIEAFHERYSLLYTDSSLAQYVYGLRNFPRWTESGKMIVDYKEIEEHRFGKKIIPSNFFGQPDTEHISAILFSNSGTWPKFNRMGYQAGYHRGNLSIIRRGFCFNPDRNSAHPALFAYDLDNAPVPECWGQGLVVLLNPNAINPLPRSFFVDAAVLYCDEGKLTADVPSFHPYSSTTFVMLRVDSGLDPNDEARKSIRSLFRREFEALGIPKNRVAPLISEEKEWFASTDRRVVGTVVRDRTDNDWVYVLFSQTENGTFQVEQVEVDIKTREKARELLLGAMEASLKSG